MISEDMEPGTRVRITTDPGRRGITTGRSRVRPDGRVLWQVTFPDGTNYIPQGQLETVPQQEDPRDLLAEGRFGRSRDLRSTITHIRLNGRLADLIYSMEITNTDFYSYQFKPVLTFLDSPSNGILIADEVGLGKTIEAGLIWTELRSRFDSRNLVILCPAMLREKWRAELLFRFGIKGDIVDAQGLKQKLNDSRNGHLDGFALICSTQGLRPSKGWDNEENPTKTKSASLARFLYQNEHEDPLVDLLIVDEAHYMRNRETSTSTLGHLLRGVSENIVLLSATPVHLRSRDLFQLLNLVDEDSFNEVHVFDDILQANEPLIAARDKILRGSSDLSSFLELLRKAKTFPLIGESRQLNKILDTPLTQADFEDRVIRSELAARLERINLLGKAVTRTRKREVTEWRVIREAVGEKVDMTEEELNFYQQVTAIIRKYCMERDVHEGFLLVTPQRQLSSSMPAALREWQQRNPDYSEQIYEDFGFDSQEVESGPLVQEIIDNVAEFGDLRELWANDSKYQRLSTMVKKALQDNPQEKIVLFAYFRPTLLYLQERLHSEHISSVVLVGGVEDKYKKIQQFSRPEGPNVLLASEVASEGVDLQFARIVINYDLPWNPMKVEQRIGRIDRLGQKSPKITIWNLFYKHTIDERIYDRLYARLKIFEKALGGLEAVLGEKIQSLTIELLRGDLTEEQENERINQTAQAVINLRTDEERLETEAANLVAHGDYILNQVSAARELGRWITGEDLNAYVRDFFQSKYQGCIFQQINEGISEFEISLSQEARFDLAQFLKQNRMSGGTRLAAETSRPVRCLFDNSVGKKKNDRAEIINQFHPLLRFVSHKIRKSIEHQETVHYPTVAVHLQQHNVPQIPKGVYGFYVENWSVQGVRSIEKIVYQATNIHTRNALEDDKAELLVNTAARMGADWFAAGNSIHLQDLEQVIDTCMDTASMRYEGFVEDLRNENNDRADMQENAMNLHLQRQLAKLDQIVLMLQQKGHHNMIAPTLGRKEKLEERVRQKLLEIKQKRELLHHSKQVSLGVIQVQ